MGVVLDLPDRTDYSALAVEKIAKELESFKGDRYGEAVKKHVAATLTHFCQENQRFAEVVYKTKRTLSDCCAEIMKGCGNSISDIDVYRGAVRNYFPNADIDFHMTITINGDAPTDDEMARRPEKTEPKAKREAATPKKPAPAKKIAAPAPAPKPAPKPAPVKKKEPETIQLTLF